MTSRQGQRGGFPLAAVGGQRDLFEPVIRGVGPLLQVMFADREAHNYGELVRTIDDAAYRRFWASMFDRGVLIPSHSSAGSVSRAHGAAEVERTVEAARAAFAEVAATTDELAASVR